MYAFYVILAAVTGPTLVLSQGGVHAEELHALVHDLQQQPVPHTRTRQRALVGHQPHSIRYIPQGAACAFNTHSAAGDFVWPLSMPLNAVLESSRGSVTDAQAWEAVKAVEFQHDHARSATVACERRLASA